MSAKRYKQKEKYFSEKVKNTKHKVQKSIALLCSAAVLATAVPVVSMMSVGAESAIYASTTAYLNMRRGAGMDYSVIKVIPQNTSVRVLRALSGWLKVRTSDGTEGYCSTDYLDITTNAKTTTYLNLRKGAGTNYSVIKTISPNVTVDVLKIVNDSWANVKLSDGTKGYVCTDYISYITSSSNSGVSQGNNSNNDTTVKNTLKLSSSSLKIAVGKSATITADASSGGKTEWKSSNTKVATVSSSGQIKGISDGTATITVTDIKTKITAKCTVNVVKTDYTSITLSKTSDTLYTGKSLTLTATTKPESNSKVNFKSSNTSVAKVSSDGKVTAVNAGTATITAYDSTGLITAKCTITVKEKDSISISKSSVSVNEGSSVSITAKASDSSMKIYWSSSDLNVAGVNNGVISGLRPGKATITASDESGKIKASCVVTVKDVSSGNVTLSRYSTSTTAGKTIYIKGYSSNSAYWGTSDSSIATVSRGFIETKKAGRVAITYSDNYGHKAVCVVTVYDAAPIKFSYSSPNSATLNSDVTLVAITDKSRQKVRFDIEVNGKTVSVEANKKYADGNTYVWKGKYRVTSAGTFNVKTYSYSGGMWKTCSDGETDIYVSSKTNPNTTGLDKLRASDELIRFIGEKEGFVSAITYDTLANNIPTLGHGYVVWEGQQFYDNLTRNEGYALLVDAVNNDSYTSKVNNMLVSNKVRFNQRQFDALVSFSYNLGTGWTSSSDLKDILLNSIGTISSGTVLTGKVTAYSGLNLRSQPTTSSNVVEVLECGERVTLASSQKYNNVWYKVKTSSGKTGYCSGTYLNIATTGEVGRDLNYVNKNALIREMLSYHHACGVCYYGLLYRRADELEMFLYGDYVADGRSNNHNFPNPYCISFP
ncbi:MAG: SH3 domain-containing protein [Clostridia bacterium]|nr:SH3 domain-containing protein [Clostridia bacterium]